jgi:hypothetical protein
MEKADYKKNASQGPYKGKSRENIFDLKIKNKSPFSITDDKKNVVTVMGKKWDKKELVLTTTDKKIPTVTLSKIIKDTDFGGNPTTKKSEGGESGTVANKDVEVLSEAFFCYYFALKCEKQLSTYTPNVWKKIKTKKELDAWCRDNGITSYVDIQNNDKAFLSRLHLAIPFLVNNGWHERLVKQMDKFYSYVNPKTSKNYEAMRADEVPSEINAQNVFMIFADKIKREYSFTKAVDKDKWNPGDVWIFSAEGKRLMTTTLTKIRQTANAPTPYKAGALSDLNKLIFDLYKKGDLYPVSLKAPGGNVHISEENIIGSSINKVARFIKIELGETNLDVKIHFAIDLYDDNTKKIIQKDYLIGKIKSKTDTGGFRLEIEAPGAAARFGSIGTENYQWIISNTDKSGIDILNKTREEFTNLEDVFPKNKEDDKGWLGASEYFSQYRKKPTNMNKLKPYMDELYSMINKDQSFKKKDPKSILNKTVASEIAVVIDQITNKLTKDIVVENLYDLAASQRFSSGIRPEQLERRKGIYAKEAKALGPKEAQYIFDSCFYLKVY